MPPGASQNRSRRPTRFGKYEVQSHIASGGMAAVYRAVDTESGREVALKILPPELAAQSNLAERFRREGEQLARLRHPHIVTLYDFGKVGDKHFLALEYVDGVDLHEYIDRKERLDPAEACVILRQALLALDHLHQHGIVHRDIKPGNFLVTRPRGALLVKLTDLGLARQEHDEEFRVTRDGHTVGTVDYIAPEQARSSTAADVRSDLYSLGCTLYHMLAGRPPFAEGGMTERLYQHIEAEPPDIRRFNRKVRAPLRAILERLLAKQPSDRYQTARDVLRAVDLIIGVMPRQGKLP